MMVVECSNCRKRRLLSLEAITEMHSTESGISVTYTCACKAVGHMTFA